MNSNASSSSIEAARASPLFTSSNAGRPAPPPEPAAAAAAATAPVVPTGRFGSRFRGRSSRFIAGFETGFVAVAASGNVVVGDADDADDEALRVLVLAPLEVVVSTFVSTFMPILAAAAVVSVVVSSCCGCASSCD